jgi:hypothetical protein
MSNQSIGSIFCKFSISQFIGLGSFHGCCLHEKFLRISFRFHNKFDQFGNCCKWERCMWSYEVESTIISEIICTTNPLWMRECKLNQWNWFGWINYDLLNRFSMLLKNLTISWPFSWICWEGTSRYINKVQYKKYQNRLILEILAKWSHSISLGLNRLFEVQKIFMICFNLKSGTMFLLVLWYWSDSVGKSCFRLSFCFVPDWEIRRASIPHFVPLNLSMWETDFD